MAIIMIVSLVAQNAYAAELASSNPAVEGSQVVKEDSQEQASSVNESSVDSQKETESSTESSDTSEPGSEESSIAPSDSTEESSQAADSSVENSASESEEPASQQEEVPQDSTSSDASEASDVTPEPTAEPTVTPEPLPTEEAAPLETMEDPDAIKYVDIADGYYRIASKLNNNRVLDVKAASREKEANIQVYANNLTSAQIFKIEGKSETVGDVTRKYYTIRAYMNTSEVLDVKAARNADGQNVQQYDANGTNAQKWYITEEAEGYYAIRTAISGATHTRALEAAGNSNGANVYINTFAAKDSQLWKFEQAIPYQPAAGMYTIHLNGTNKVMDVAGNVGANGTNVDVYTANGTSAQQFYLKPLGYGGLYSIIGVASRNAVDIDNNRTAAGTKIHTWRYAGSNQQIVRFDGTGASADGQPVFRIIAKSGAKFSVNGSDVQVGSTAAEWYLTGISGQTAVDTIAQGFYYITTKLNTDMAVDIKSGSLDNGGIAQLYKKNSTNAQKYKLLFTSDGYVRFQNIGSGKGLNVDKAARRNGTKVHQWALNSTENFKFKIVPTNDGDGSVYLQFSNSAFYLDVPSAKATNGNALHIYKGNRTTAQKFFLEKTVTKTGWQTFMGGQRKLYDSKGNYYKNTTVDGIEVGADGTPKETWVYVDGFWRYRVGNTYVNDVRPYLSKLFGTKTVPTKSLSGFTEPAVSAPATPGYYATLDRSKALVTIYTKYPGSNSWNLPVCAFKCSPGMNDTPTDPGTRWTVANARWSELMGPSYGQYTTRLSKPGSTSKWSGELFHSVPCGSPNNHNVPRGMYNALGRKASHGCIRMDVRNCYWICKFCPKGMMVKVGDNLSAPIKAVPQPKMRSGNVDPTDPAYTGNYGYVDTNVYYGNYYF